MNKIDLKTLLHELSVVNLVSLLSSYDNLHEGFYVVDAIRKENEMLQVEGVFKKDDSNTILEGNEVDYATKICIDLRLSTKLLSQLLFEFDKASFKYLRWSFELPISVIFEHSLTLDMCRHGSVTFDDDEKLIYEDFSDLTKILLVDN